MEKITKQMLAAGAASAFCFVLCVIFLGPLFILTPVIPIIICWVMFGLNQAFIAAAIGALLVSIFGIEAIILYGFLSALPSVLFAAYFEKTKEAGNAITEVVFFCAVLIIAIHFSLIGEGGLDKFLLKSIKPEIIKIDASAYQVLEQSPHLIIAALSWWFIMLHYLHAYIATHIVQKKYGNTNKNPLALSVFTPPKQLLYLVPLMVFISFIDKNQSFIANSILLIFLLPYALNGFMYAHSKLRALYGSKAVIFLFCLYASSLFLIWPVLVVACIGIWQHLQQLGFVAK